MEFLRSRLFVVLVALLVWGGYAETLLGGCHAVSVSDTAGCCENSGERHDDGHEDFACHCLCHQVLANEAPGEPLAPVVAQRAPRCALAGDVAPDGVPAAIDHPPQLA